ncbi:hypothetical protein ABFT23_10115 [Nocardioides sp. C4-1]
MSKFRALIASSLLAAAVVGGAAVAAPAQGTDSAASVWCCK